MSSQIAKFENLKSLWSQYSDLSLIQSSQRAKDIDNLVQVIEGKISADSIFTIAKQQQVLEQQCQEIKLQMDQIRASYIQMGEEEKQNIEYFNSKCEQDCQSVRNGINQDRQEMLQISDEVINNIKQNVAKDCLVSIQETNKHKKQILGCKSFIQEQIKRYEKSQTESLNKLHKKVNEEITEISHCLQLKKLEKQERQEKLQLMSEAVFSDLNKIIHKEEKIGQLTYESLLKLIEDFYFHMRTTNGLQ